MSQANGEIASGPLSSLKIVYDNDTGIYRAGDRMTGKLQIGLRQALTLRVIRLQIKGRSVWTGDGSKKQEAEKVIFNRDIVLLDRPPGREPGDFPYQPGTHYLPWENPLPRNAPTSHEAGVAFVRYYCKATVIQAVNEGKGHEVQFQVKSPFTLLSLAPATFDQELMRPVGASESTTITSCCCIRGKLTGDIGLQKGCYVPGETISASLKIENGHSRHLVEGVDVQFVEQVGRSGVTPVERVLSSRRLDQSKLTGRQNLSREAVPLISVPPVAPSVSQKLWVPPTSPSLDDSALPPAFNDSTLKRLEVARPLYDIQYQLRLVCGPKLSVSVPVQVGGCPLSRESGYPAPAEYKETPLGPFNVREADDIANTAGHFEFTPRYPVCDPSGRKTSQKPATLPVVPIAAPRATAVTSVPNESTDRQLVSSIPSPGGDGDVLLTEITKTSHHVVHSSSPTRDGGEVVTTKTTTTREIVHSPQLDGAQMVINSPDNAQMVISSPDGDVVRQITNVSSPDGEFVREITNAHREVRDGVETDHVETTVVRTSQVVVDTVDTTVSSQQGGPNSTAV